MITSEPMDRTRLFYDIFGAEIATDSLIYSLTRDMYDRTFQEKNEGKKTSPGIIRHFHEDKEKISIMFERETLVIEFIDDHLLKVTWRDPSVDTNINRVECHCESFELVKEKNDIIVRCGNIKISISPNGKMDYAYRGMKVRSEYPPIFWGGKTLTMAKIRSDSKFYGLGEKALGLNLRGTKSVLWNHDANGCYNPGDDPLYLNIPFYVDIKGEDGYFIFYNNPSRATFDISYSVKDRISVEFNESSLQYFIGFGNFKDVMMSYTSITGKPMIPPQWALGFHQSRYSYMSDDEIMKIFNGFNRENLPISAIHMDIDYMREFRVFTTDDKRFAGLDKLSETLAKKGVRLVTIIDPAIKMDPTFDIFNDGVSNDHFIKYPDGNIVYAPVWAGMSAFPDFSRAETRKWWGEKYEYLLKKGISGFWHDMNEPATFSPWGDNTLPECAVLNAGSHSNVHNLYGLWMAKAAYEYLRNKGERPFILTRSGWAGIQRFAFVWTGDTNSTWAEMRSSLSTLLNLGMSGVPYVGVDIGGFAGNPNDELFVRWFQLGSFSPFFRVHSSKGTNSREPWSFGKRNLEIIRKYLNLRYELMPFYYTLAYESHTTGMPMMRPVSCIDPEYDGPEDSCFILGESVLVFPVFEPHYTSMEIKLPEGKWYYFWDDSLHEDHVSLAINTGVLPVFVREGSIIPAGMNGKITLHIYLGNKCEGYIYIDDGRLEPSYKIYHFRCIYRKSEWFLSMEEDGTYDTGLSVLTVTVHGYTLRKENNPDLDINIEKNSFPFPLSEKEIGFK